MKAADKKSLALVIALTIALAEAFAIFTIIFVQYRGLQLHYQDLQQRFSELEGQAGRASKIFAVTSPSVVTVKAARSDGVLMQGSGFLYCCKGNIVTSFHVVANATSITVVYSDKTTANATLAGCDTYTDIAVIRAESFPATIAPLPLGNSSALKVGETVYAIGSPYGLSASLSVGVVSGKERLILLADLGMPLPQGAYAVADLIQFDAAVGSGSSGSPLLNGDGDVVGIIFAARESGIAFAVSVDIAKRAVSSIIQRGRYDHPWLGVGYDPEYIGGMKVLYVFPGSPAERTGLREGDVITAVDGSQVRSPQEFITFIEKFRSPGDRILLTVERDGLCHLMQLELKARP